MKKNELLHDGVSEMVKELEPKFDDNPSIHTQNSSMQIEMSDFLGQNTLTKFGNVSFLLLC